MWVGLISQVRAMQEKTETGNSGSGSIQSYGLGGVPDRQSLFVSRDKAQILHDRLDIAPPGELDSAPAVLTFSRARRISLPWKQIVEEFADDKTVLASIRSHRDYFEQSWWGGSTDVEKNLGNLRNREENLFFIRVTETEPAKEPEPAPAEDPTPEPAPEPAPDDGKPVFYRSNFDPEAATGTAIPSGLFFRHGTSGRVYLVHLDGDTPLTSADEFLASTEAYENFWSNRVASIELVFESGDDAQSGMSTYSVLDMRAPYIIQRYRELETVKEIATKLDDLAKKTIQDLIEAQAGAAYDFEGLDELQARYTNLRLAPQRVEANFQRLKKQSQDMGYVLFHTGDTAGTFPDGTPQVATAGNLYRVSRQPFTWTVYHPKTIFEIVGGVLLSAVRAIFGGRRYREVEVAEAETKTANFDRYDLVDPSVDHLAENVMAMQNAGKIVHVFEESPGGYVTGDGTPIDEVMDRCGYSEAFRLNCVIMIPEYDRSLTGKKIIAKYHVFEKPLPGIAATQLPVLTIKESLSYRTVWKGIELGELASSINLAPGEERQITITRSFQKETTSTETRTSVFELSSSESTDFSEELESTARKETETSSKIDTKQSMKASNETTAEAGFSSPASPWSGSVSNTSKFEAESGVEMSSGQSLKSFNNSMNKSARKAARAVNQNNKQEVSSTTSERTTVSSTDSTTIKITNINQGRTLNLMFHQVFNRFSGGLYLEDIGFQVHSGIELIDGSGIYPRRDIEFDDVDGLTEELMRTPLPLNLDDDQQEIYQLRVLESLDRLLEREYETKPDEDDDESGDGNAGQARRKTVRRTGSTETGDEQPDAKATDAGPPPITLNRKRHGIFWGHTPRAEPNDDGRNDKLLKTLPPKEQLKLDDIKLRLSKLYRTLEVSNVSLTAADLLIKSPGLYLDSLLGVRAATEPYSEEMRAQQVRQRAADVLAKEAEATYQLAQADRIGSGSGRRMGTADNGNAIIGALPDEHYRSLTIRLKFLLGPGDWVLCFDEKPVAGVRLTPTQLNQFVLTVQIPRRGAPEWIRDDDFAGRLSFWDRDNEVRVR